MPFRKTEKGMARQFCGGTASCGGTGASLFYGPLLAMLVALPWLLATPALAQGLGAGALVERLDRLERDLQTLQREFYRDGATPSSPVTGSPATGSPEASGAASSSPGTDADAPPPAARAELRFVELETQIRDLTGKVEEIQFRLSELGDRLDLLTGDLALRLDAIEGRLAGGEQGGIGQAGAVKTASSPTYGTPTSETLTPETLTSKASVSKASALAETAAPDDDVAAKAVLLPPKEAYGQAFSLLGRREYVEAERELKAFLEAYPDDPLAPNATYWLGETYYVRNDFRQASVIFLQGYQKNPKGSKAPDNLFKLAKSLGNIGQKKEACTTLSRLKKEFPKLPTAVFQRAEAERKRNGCP